MLHSSMAIKMLSLQKAERSSSLSNRYESKKAVLYSTEMACYTGQSVCNLYHNGVATQVAEKLPRVTLV